MVGKKGVAIMILNYQGNLVTLIIQAGEGNPPVIRLSDGYTFEKIHILASANVGYLIPSDQFK